MNSYNFSWPNYVIQSRLQNLEKSRGTSSVQWPQTIRRLPNELRSRFQWPCPSPLPSGQLLRTCWGQDLAAYRSASSVAKETSRPFCPTRRQNDHSCSGLSQCLPPGKWGWGCLGPWTSWTTSPENEIDIVIIFSSTGLCYVSLTRNTSRCGLDDKSAILPWKYNVLFWRSSVGCGPSGHTTQK